MNDRARQVRNDKHLASNERAWGIFEDTDARPQHIIRKAPLDIQRKGPDEAGAEASDSITVDTGTEEAETSAPVNEVGLEGRLDNTEQIREAENDKPDPDSALDAPIVARQPRQSSIHQLVDRYGNGRRYAGYGVYWAPSDEKQNNLLDIAHHLYDLMLDDKLFLAPIGDNPRSVLDTGTGTGIWAMEFADQYPSAQIIGFDLSPVQPERAVPNVRFEIKDACDPDWGYEKDSLDFIHVRAMYGCIADWPAFYQQVLA